MVPETQRKAGKALEVEREQNEEIAKADTAWVEDTVERRKASSSLGCTPSPKVRQPHRQGVSRLHLTRDVKVLPTVEKFPSLPRSSRGFSISQTPSEYIPSPDLSQSSCTSRISYGMVVQPTIEDAAEVKATHSRQGTPQGKSLFPDLAICDTFLRLPRHHPTVQVFRQALWERFRQIRLETAESLTAILRQCDAVELKRSRDLIASNYQKLSFILDRYYKLRRARLINRRDSTINWMKSTRRKYQNRLAEIDRASIEPSASLTSGHHSSETQSHEPRDKSKADSANASQVLSLYNVVSVVR